MRYYAGTYGYTWAVATPTEEELATVDEDDIIDVR